MKRLSPFILLISTIASAQLQRYDTFAATTTSASGIGNLLQAIPNATITVFNYPGAGVSCAAGGCVAATTYTSRTGLVSCGAAVPLTRPTSTTCIGTADAQGNFGWWAAAAVYQYCVAATSFTTQCYNVNLGMDTTSVLNNVIWVCNTVYPCTDAGLQAAQNTLTSGGTIAIPPQTGVTISNTVNINNPNIAIMGAGPGSSIQVAIAGDVFNVTNQRFRLHDLEFGLPTTTRTGALVHASSSGAVIGSVYNVDIVGNATSTNNGHFFLMDTANANQWDFDRIYMPRGTTWTTAFKFVNSSGSATASTFAIKEFRGGATFTDAGLVLDGAIDTLQVIQSTWNADGGSGKSIWIRNTVAGFINPRFIYFTQVSNEATDGGGHTSTVMQLDAGRQVHYNNGYCANTTNCFVIGASAIDTDISHNTAATIQQSFATVASGALRTIIDANDIQDTSQQTSNTFDTVAIAAGATDVNVDGNIQGCSGAIFPRYLTSVGAGGGDRIRILGNNIAPSCTGSAVVNNQGSGADILVANNTQVANNFPIKIGEGNAPTSFANQDICYGDSTLHALKCSYNNGTFFQIPQDITATSAAFATATTAGTCVQNTTAVTGAATTMSVLVSPVSTPGVGAQWSAFVSSAGNVTINECAVATSAGGTIAFNIRVIP